MEEIGRVSYRFGRNSIVFALEYERLMEILPKHTNLQTKFQQYKRQVLL